MTEGFFDPDNDASFDRAAARNRGWGDFVDRMSIGTAPAPTAEVGSSGGRAQLPPFDEAISINEGPAELTYRPTSTTNPARPRTVAAGYRSQTKTLSVMFRDEPDRVYNYYGVSGLEWGNFRRARSKGVYIRVTLDGRERGWADLSQQSQDDLTELTNTYTEARDQQEIDGGVTGGQKANSPRGKIENARKYGNKASTDADGNRTHLGGSTRNQDLDQAVLDYYRNRFQ